jgi:hypothetical protein
MAKPWGVRAGDVFGLLFVVAVVYILGRPASGAAQLVQAMSQAGVALVKRATSIA